MLAHTSFVEYGKRGAWIIFPLLIGLSQIGCVWMGAITSFTSAPAAAPTTVSPSTITLRAAGATLSQNLSTSSITLSRPIEVVSGDVEIAQVWSKNAGSAADIVAPEGWLPVSNGLSTLADGGFSSTHALFYKVAGSSEPLSYIFATSSPSSQAGGEIIAYFGVDSTAPVDAAGCASGVLTPDYQGEATAPPITVSQSNEKILFLAASTRLPLPAVPISNQFNQVLKFSSDTYIGDWVYDQSVQNPGATSSLSLFTGGYQRYFACQIAIEPANTNPILLRSTSALTYNDGTDCTANAGAACNITISAPAGVRPGDFIFAQVAFSNANEYPVFTPPAGWTQLRVDQFMDTSAAFFEQYLFYKIATSNEPANYTFTQPTNSSDYNGGFIGVAFAYSSTNGSTPVDALSCNSGYPNSFGSLISAPSVVTSEPRDKLVFLYSVVGGRPYGTIDVLADFNQQWLNNDSVNSQSIYGADMSAPSAGVYGNKAINVGYGNDWFACQLGLNPLTQNGAAH